MEPDPCVSDSCATGGTPPRDPFSAKPGEPKPTFALRSSFEAARSEPTPSSPVLVQQVFSSPLNSTPGRDFPSVAMVSPRSREQERTREEPKKDQVRVRILISVLVFVVLRPFYWCSLYLEPTDVNTLRDPVSSVTETRSQNL